jgi:hypothetical protein
VSITLFRPYSPDIWDMGFHLRPISSFMLQDATGRYLESLLQKYLKTAESERTPVGACVSSSASIYPLLYR